MTISPDTGAPISLNEAKSLTAAFRTNYPNDIKAFFVGVNRIKELLGQEDCIGIRIYNGWNNDNKCFQDMLVGVDSKGCDITALVIDRMSPCPDICDHTSPLV